MKHIGWCLDKIQVAFMHMPKDVTSEEDKIAANSIIDEIQEYSKTFKEILLNPKFEKYLHQLEKTSIEKVRLQAHEIERLHKDLEHMSQVLDYYINEIRDIIKNRPEQWHTRAKDLIHTIDQKFGGERGELREEFTIALHTIDELKDIVSSEKHLAEFLEL